MKQFSNKFDILYLKENNPWAGGVHKAYQAVSILPQGCFGKSKFSRALEQQRGHRTLPAGFAYLTLFRKIKRPMK